MRRVLDAFVLPALPVSLASVFAAPTALASEPNAGPRNVGGLVSVDFNFEESPLFDAPGVLGGDDDTYWNPEYPGYGDPWYMAGWLESDGVTESDLHVAFRIDLVGRTAPGHPLLRDHAGGRTDFSSPQLPDPGPSVLIIEGLTPGIMYDIAIYSTFSAGVEVTIDGQTLATTGSGTDELEEGANYVVFRDIEADSSGRIEGVLDDSDIDTASGLYEIGGFQIAPSDMDCCCPADLNGDGELTNTDINAFVNAFLSEDSAADINSDGEFNNADVNQYVGEFLLGCV